MATAEPAGGTITTDAQVYKVGVAEIDITPDYPIRMNGFLGRKQESIGIRQPIWAKALAIGEGADAAVLITVDALGIPAELTTEIGRRLQKTTGLMPNRLAITASHTHTAPMINGCAPNIFGEPIPPDAQAHIDRYTTELTDKLEQVGLAALNDKRDSTMHWGIGLVTFAKNRRDKNGPFDHDLPLLVVRSTAGELRAIYVSYACHCVTLSEPRIGGDWAGFAQEQIEKRYPGAVALVSVGCAGDQNPISDVVNDRADVALGQGEEIAVEVDRLLAGTLRPIRGALRVQTDEIQLPLAMLPTREEFEQLAKEQTPVGYHARVQLAKLDRGEALRQQVTYPIQSWAFGDSLAMVFLAGEVVSEYGLRLKTELDGCKVWVNAYSNDCPCYIPSEKVLRVGGYEGGGAMIYYDQPTRFAPGLEQPIIDTLLKQLKETFPPAIQAGKGQGTRPRAPEQSLKLMRTHDELQVELVAAEPLVASPVAVDFGPDGKIWVAEMVDYPSGIDGNFSPGGRIRLLETSKENGAVNRSTVFLEGIPFPTGVTVWRKGVLVCAAPDILYAEDTSGDGRADVVRKLYSGFGTDNYQARVNSLEYGLDGWVYGSCGLFGGTIKSFASDEPLELGDRDFRIQPDTGLIEPASGRTQQGRVRDDFDNWFGCNNSQLCFHYPLAVHNENRNPFAPPPPGAANVPASREDEKLIPASESLQLFKLSGASGSATAACGLGIYRDSLLGESFRGNAFTCEPVNLLVHRLVLSPRDSTFVGRRASEESNREFLSSTDTWFRPVQVRTAPDGSLWILDMYRFVIEHPRWIPAETLAQIDVEAGSTLGRIYRIRPRSTNTLTWPRLSELAPEELVAAIDSSNGWQRDMAMQILVWNKPSHGPGVIDALRNLAHSATQPEVRLQALATLSQLRQPTFGDVMAAMDDQHPGVRRLGLRLGEAFAAEPPLKGEDAQRASDQLQARAIKLSRDEDGQVRLQAACSLHAWPSDSVAEALADVTLSHSQDRYLRSAVISSLTSKNIMPFTQRLLSGSQSSLNSVASSLLPLAFVMMETEQAAQLLERVAKIDESQSQTSWQWTTLATLLDHVEKNPAIRREIERLKFDERVAAAVAQARVLVQQSEAPEPVRIAAMSVLNRGSLISKNERVSHHRLMLELLSPRSSSAVQQACVHGVLRGDQSSVAHDLLSAWKQLSPQIKSSVLDGLLSRDEWLQIVLDQLEQRQVDVAELDAARRQRLLTHHDRNVRLRAEKLFAGKLNPDRAHVIESYQGVHALSGDPLRGGELFRKHCASCHRIADVGSSVGPDLVPLASKPAAFFLQEILDPNRNLDSRYMSYTALTVDGRALTGLLVAETPTAITLRAADAKEESLQREDVEQLSSNRASLMPEGLEKLLAPNDLADVIAYVRTSAQQTEPPQKMAAGELARDILNEALTEEARQQLISAAVQSAAEVITAMAANMPQDAQEEYRRIPWLWRVAIAAGKEANQDRLRQVIEASLPKDGQPLRDWQAVVIGGGIINGLSLRGDWPKRSINAMLVRNDRLQAKWQELLKSSRAMADNEQVRTGTRYDALRIVAMDDWAKCREQLTRYLSRDVDAELQMGSVSGLADVEEIDAGRLLLDRIGQLTPHNRSLAISALTRGAERQTLLLKALEGKQLKANELSDTDRAALLKSDNERVAIRAKRLLEN